MEAKINSYYGRGYSDYLYAKAGMEVGRVHGDYNGVAAMCAQAAEKYLKAILERCTMDQEVMTLLRSHNLRALLNRIKQDYPEFEASTKDVKWLGDFYFDARYPGDNFVVVTQEDAEECLRLTKELQERTQELLGKEEQKQKEKKHIIQNLDEFTI
ncbi:MAG: hypothetical protein PWP24_1287 [Clostridiales bacterium]|nr:hypothetical protein [Clostridiales bacterium]